MIGVLASMAAIIEKFHISFTISLVPKKSSSPHPEGEGLGARAFTQELDQ